MSNYDPVQTYFDGVKFRSRSEAMFAAYLNRRNIDWEYEPYLAPEWMPDFACCQGSVAVDLRVAQSVEDFKEARVYMRIFSVPLGAEIVWLIPTSPVPSVERPGYASLGWMLTQDGEVSEIPFTVDGQHLTYRDACAYWKGVWIEVIEATELAIAA